jgi:hypothetical protein
MKAKILKLGTIVTDSATGVDGMLTIVAFDMDGGNLYMFQPRGLNPKTGAPVDRLILSKARVIGGEEIDVELPLEILGNEAEDLATGFKGTVVQVDYHINGCIHVDIKPKGIIAETGATIDSQSFDLRRLKGTKIKELSAKELEESKITTPSPEEGFHRKH